MDEVRFAFYPPIVDDNEVGLTVLPVLINNNFR